MSDTLWPHGLWPARFLCPLNFPDRNTGVGCHFLLQGIFPRPGIEPMRLQWKCSVWTTGPPGKSPANVFFPFNMYSFVFYLAVPGLSCSMWDLILSPGFEPGSCALGARSLSNWFTRDVFFSNFSRHFSPLFHCMS